MSFISQLGEIGDGFLDIIEAGADSFASNINANATADQARAAALAASVEISTMKARNAERRKDELLYIFKVLLFGLLGAGILTLLILSSIKMKKK